MDILVIGGSGLVGSNIREMALKNGHNVHSTYLTAQNDAAEIQLDKTLYEPTKDFLVDVEPDVVVDTAAFQKVDECETNRQEAWKVNAAGTRNAAVAADNIDAHFIYLSTDYVFPGVPNEAPYKEGDSVAPVNYYGRTKLAGEQAARIADTVTILRPSVIYGSSSSNFATWALDELRNGNEISIVDDQISTPTYAPDLAESILSAAIGDLTGLYHSAGPSSLSRYEFTVMLADINGYDTDLVSPISTAEFGQEAARPGNSSLDSTSLYEDSGVKFRAPEEAINLVDTNEE